MGWFAVCHRTGPAGTWAKKREESNMMPSSPTRPIQEITRACMALFLVLTPLPILCSCPLLEGPGSSLPSFGSSASPLPKLSAVLLVSPPPQPLQKCVREGMCRALAPASQPPRSVPRCPLAQLTYVRLFTHTSTSQAKLSLFPAKSWPHLATHTTPPQCQRSHQVSCTVQRTRCDLLNTGGLPSS